MPAPTIRFWSKKAVLYKPEATYNTDPVPTGAANWMEAHNVTLTPQDFDVEERNVTRINMGNGTKVVTGKRVKLAFDVPLAASGTLGTAPKIGPLLLGCGFAETVVAVTSVTYNLVSSAFGSGTFYINIDGTLHKGTGARGTWSIKMDKGLPMLHVELTSLYIVPTDTAMPATTRTGWPTEYPANAANTLVCTVNGVASYYSKFEVAGVNQLVHDNLPGGYEAIAIKGRAPSGSMSILAPTLAVLDPFALKVAQTNIAIQVVHGPTAGNKVQVDLKTPIVDVAYEDIDGSVGYALSLAPSDPTDLNTEITLVFV